MSSSRRLSITALVFGLVVLFAADAGAFSARAIDLKLNDLIYNPADHLLYVSVPGNVPERGNTISLIDPATGTFVGAIPVGSQPRVLALSQDGGTLYVGLAGAGSVQRVDLKTRAVTLDIPLPVDPFFGPTFAADIAVMPGHPNTIVVSFGYSGVSPSHAGVAVFDDAVMRPTRTPGHTGSNRIEFGSAADRVYGLNIETSEYGFRRLQIDANGITELSVTPDLIPGWPEFEWFNGRIYSNGGRVIDPEGLRVLGTFPLSPDDYDRSVAPDTAITYFLARPFGGGYPVKLQRFNTNTFALLNERPIRGAFEPPVGAVRWGAEGLAYYTFDFFSDNGRIWVLDGINDPPNADLAVSVRESRDPATIGDYLTYTVTMKNLGSDDATGAMLQTYFDGGYDLVYMQSPRGDCTTSAATHTCAFGTIAVGDSVTATFTFQPDHEGVLTIHAAGASAVQDPNPANNSVTETTTIVLQPAKADLFVSASPLTNPIVVGETATLVVDIGNRGAVPAEAARLHTILGGRYRIESYENQNGTCTAFDQENTCELGTIAPGGQAQVRIHVTPLEVGYLLGTFQVESATPEATPYDNFASAYIVVTVSPESRIDTLIAHVEAYALKNGPEKSLLRPLDDARAAAVADDTPGTCAALLDFEDALGKRVGRALSIPAAYSLMAEAETIREMVGCYAAVGGRHFTPQARTHDATTPPESPASAPRTPVLLLGPNPSATASRLSFDLGRAGHAKLSVFDVRGRLVEVLADGTFTSGPHEITWQHPGAPGVYFYRFEPEGGAPITTRGVILP